MARPNRSLKQIERLAKTRVAKMRCVEDQTQPVHLDQKFAPALADAPVGISPERVGARPVMRRSQGAQSLFETAFEMVQRDDGISSLEAQNVTDGAVRAV